MQWWWLIIYVVSCMIYNCILLNLPSYLLTAQFMWVEGDVYIYNIVIVYNYWPLAGVHCIQSQPACINYGPCLAGLSDVGTHSRLYPQNCMGGWWLVGCVDPACIRLLALVTLGTLTLWLMEQEHSRHTSWWYGWQLLVSAWGWVCSG